MFFKKYRLPIIVFLLLFLGSTFLFVVMSSFLNKEKEKQRIRLETAHYDAIAEFNSGIQKLNIITAGVRSFVKESNHELPSQEYFFRFFKSQLNMLISTDSIAASFIDTNLIFISTVSQNQIDPRNLVGKKITAIRPELDEKILDSLIKNEGRMLQEPFNVKQTNWSGVIMIHGVHKNNKPIGFVAVLINLNYILDAIYTSQDTTKFAYRFTTQKGIDFDRYNVYDEQDYNDTIDPESFNNFKINEKNVLYTYHQFYGQTIRIGTAYKKEPETLVFDFIYPIFILLFMYILFIAYQVWRTDTLNKKLSILSDNLKEKNAEFLNSVNYARRIQRAILPNITTIRKSLKNCFVYFKPKSIISGDFYWFNSIKGKDIIAAIDCTGHGVPGALMSAIGNSSLNNIVLSKKILTPNLILQQLDKRIITLLNQDTEGSNKDGMDIALCSIDNKTKTLEFAGAFRSLYIVRNNKIKVYKGDRYPIGGLNLEENRVYTNYNIHYEKGDMCYMFTDGITDQFGGADNKKYMQKQFNELLISIHHLPADEQQDIIRATFTNWKGEKEQTDDVLVIGFRL